MTIEELRQKIKNRDCVHNPSCANCVHGDEGICTVDDGISVECAAGGLCLGYKKAWWAIESRNN